MTKAPCVDSIESRPLVCFFTSAGRGRNIIFLVGWRGRVIVLTSHTDRNWEGSY